MEYQIIFSLVLILLAFGSILPKSTATMTDAIMEDNTDMQHLNANNLLDATQEDAQQLS